MNNERAIEVLEMLLDGVHPVTGEILPEKGIHTEPDVIMALYKSVEAIYSEAGGKFQARSTQGQYTKRGKLNAGRPWSEEDDQELRKLYKNQVPVERMCVILQRRPRGINNRLMCLGLMQRTTDRYGNQIKPGLERVGTQWMPEEDARLREMFNEGKPIEEMMKAFHRSEKGIKYRLERLQLIEEAEKYPEETGTSSRFDNEDLRRRFLQEETVSQIAAIYGQSEQAIRARLFYIGLGGNGPRVLPDRKKEN